MASRVTGEQQIKRSTHTDRVAGRYCRATVIDGSGTSRSQSRGTEHMFEILGDGAEPRKGCPTAGRAAEVRPGPTSWNQKWCETVLNNAATRASGDSDLRKLSSSRPLTSSFVQAELCENR